MKRNTKITLCGMMAALSAAMMLLSYFPYLTYAVPAVTGLFMMVAVIETNLKWAAGSYAAASVLIFLLAEPEAKLMYIFLFGYYPIVKALIERINKPVPEWIIKFAVFFAAVAVVYLLLSGIFGIKIEDAGSFGKYGTAVTLALGCAAFVLYDIAVSRMSGFYMARLHTRISRLLNK